MNYPDIQDFFQTQVNKIIFEAYKNNNEDFFNYTWAQEPVVKNTHITLAFCCNIKSAVIITNHIRASMPFFTIYDNFIMLDNFGLLNITMFPADNIDAPCDSIINMYYWFYMAVYQAKKSNISIEVVSSFVKDGVIVFSVDGLDQAISDFESIVNSLIPNFKLTKHNAYPLFDLYDFIFKYKHLDKPEVTTYNGMDVEIFSTGAVRQVSTNRIRPDLISPYAIERLGDRLAAGARKYTERNWEAGMPVSRYFESLMRHCLSYQKGDNSEDHLGAILFNAMAIADHEARVQNGELPEWIIDMGPENK